MGKGKERRRRRRKKNKKKVLVGTYTEEEGMEFYSIDLQAEAVTKLATELLDKEGIVASVVPLASRVYLFGFERLSPPSVLENESQNERGFVHSHVSYIDIVDEKEKEDKASAVWKAGPPHPVAAPRPLLWCPDCLFVDGKIYCFTFKSPKAEVYDPDLNQWRTQLISPPNGYKNFCFQKPVLYDRANNRLLVSFHRDGPVGSLYAYYPGGGGRWDLLVPQYEPHSFMLAVDSGVIFSYDCDPHRNTLFAAFDVDSKTNLNIDYSSDFDQRLWNLEFYELLHVGDSTLCLVAPAISDSAKTYIYTIRFKIHRKGPLHVVLTPFPGKFFSLLNDRHPISYSAF